MFLPALGSLSLAKAPRSQNQKLKFRKFKPIIKSLPKVRHEPVSVLGTPDWEREGD